MPANSRHKQYLAQAPRWQLVKHIVDNTAIKYLRSVDPNDLERSRLYKENAILTNFVALTKSGLTGLVFRKPATIELPSDLEYLKDDVTGDGLSLEHFAQRVVGEALEKGRYGILADYPPTPDEMDAETEKKYSYAAHLKGYTADTIINWHTRVIGGKTVLDLVVLEECVDFIKEDGFEWEEVIQYRALRLDGAGLYRQEIWSQELELISVYYPTKKDGSNFDYIPFIIIGSENNDPNVDNIPLYDLAVLNLGHYKNSADLEESGHTCGQIFLTIFAEVDQASFKAANPNGVQWGSRQGLFIPTGSGDAKLLQANPNQLISQMMLDKRDYAISLGARLIAPAGGRETAEGARIRMGSQNSSLYVLSKNCGSGIEQAIEWVAEFMGSAPESIHYELNDQFYDESADPVLIAQEILMLDRNALTIKEFRDNRRYDGVLDPDSTDEGIDFQVHTQDPLAGNNVS